MEVKFAHVLIYPGNDSIKKIPWSIRLGMNHSGSGGQ